MNFPYFIKNECFKKLYFADENSEKAKIPVSNSDYFSLAYLQMDKVRLLPLKLMVETGHLPH